MATVYQNNYRVVETCPEHFECNRRHSMFSLQFSPDITPGKTLENLGRLTASGKLADRDIESRIARLGERFRIYASTCPHGLWAPGLALTAEARGAAEIYLPMAELRSAFSRFLSVSLKYSPLTMETAIDNAPTWIDALHQLQPHVTRSDPAELLQRLMSDESFRIRFLFALFLPKRHGGDFNRYPDQWEFLRQWLKTERQTGDDFLRCLDTACATGESTYELALFLLENGMKPDSFLVHGSTVEPLELFAAAHIFFPHEPKRQAAFRKRAEPAFAAGADKRILFFTEDISWPVGEQGKQYDIILCNGLLGGPKYHTVADLERMASALASRLHEGGIILAANRFHGGWKKLVPDLLIHRAFTKAGLCVRQVTDGIIAQKT